MNIRSNSNIKLISRHIANSKIDKLIQIPNIYRMVILDMPIITNIESEKRAKSILRNLLREEIEQRSKFKSFDPERLLSIIINRLSWQQSRLMRILVGDDFLRKDVESQQMWKSALRDISFLSHDFAEKLMQSVQFLLELVEEVEIAIQLGQLSGPDLIFRFDLGDFHKRNRATLQVVDKTTGNSLYYKPRPPKLESVMQKFLEKTNFYSKIGMPAVFPGKYGHWASAVTTKEEDPSDYTQAIAQLVHFCMTFNLTDMHADNYIKKSGIIHIVDGETFFASRPKFASGHDGQSYSEIYDVFATTVVANEFDLNVDPLDGTGLSHFFDKSKFDVMQIGLILNHIEQMNRELGSLFIDQINDAFLSDCNFRYLHRDTKSYFWILDMLAHPHTLRDSAGFSESAEIALANLFGTNDIASQVVNKSELRQLLNGDVPYFYRKFGSRDLFDDNGFVFADYFDQSHIEKIREKSADRHAYQCTNAAKLKLSLQIEFTDTQVREPELVGEPLEIANDILDLGRLRSKDGLPYWIGVTPSFDDKVFRVLNTQPLDFYAGTIGIVSSLAVNYHRSQDEERLKDLCALKFIIPIEFSQDTISIGVVIDTVRYLWMCEHQYSNVRNYIEIALNALVLLIPTNESEFDFLLGWAGMFSLVSHWETAAAVMRRKLTNQSFHDGIKRRIQEYVVYVSQQIEELAPSSILSGKSDQRQFGMAHGLAGHLQAFHDISHANFFQSLGGTLPQSASGTFSSISRIVENRLEGQLSDDHDMRWCNGKLGELLAVVQATENTSLANYAAEWALEKSGLEFERSHFCCGEAGFLYFQYVLTKENRINHHLRSEVQTHMNTRADQLESALRKHKLKFGTGINRYSANPTLFTGICGVSLVLELLKFSESRHSRRGPWLRDAPI